MSMQNVLNGNTTFEIRISIFVHCLAITLLFISTAFAFLAAYNVLQISEIPWISTIASFLWLSFSTFVAYSTFKESNDLRHSIQRILFWFSFHHFLRIDSNEGGNRHLSYCYKLLSIDVCLQSISLDKIFAVEWAPGQASSLAGRDMDDWEPAICFFGNS